MGRIGHQNEATGAILYLASDALASYVTGSHLLVDGGAAAAGDAPASLVRRIALVLRQQPVRIETGDIVDDHLVELGRAAHLEEM